MSEEPRKRVERGLVFGSEARTSPVTDVLVQDRMALYGVPGMSVAVIDERRVAWTAEYGLAAGDQKVPVTETTLFQCCSASKMAASLLSLRLVELGKLSLDGEVNSYLSSWKLRDTSDVEASVTLRQVLSHTAGINVHGAPGYPRGTEFPSLEQVLEGEPPAITAPVRVTSAGSRNYRYSGGGYCVLQKLIEDVLEQPFELAAAEFVLAPLEMKNSTFAQPLPPEFETNAASAHLTLSNNPCSERWFVYPEKAVGGLWTTANDLAQIILEIQNAAAGKGRLLSKESAAEMLTIHSDNYNAGLGTYVGNRGKASEFFSHTGAHLGWQAIAVGYRNLGKGAVILTNNGYTGSELYREYLLAIRNEYSWPEFDGSLR